MNVAKTIVIFMTGVAFGLSIPLFIFVDGLFAILVVFSSAAIIITIVLWIVEHWND